MVKLWRKSKRMLKKRNMMSKNQSKNNDMSLWNADQFKSLNPSQSRALWRRSPR